MNLRSLSPVILLFASSLLQAQDALSEFRVFTRDLSSLTGSFSQEVRDKNGRVSRTSAGTFSLARPGMFRFVYEKPYKQTIVSDGTTVWLHDEDLNQVTVRKIGDSLSEQPLSLLLDPQSAEKVFDIKAAPAQGSIAYLTAKAKKADVAVSDLAIALVGGQPSEITWRDALQNINTLRLTSLAKNAKVSNERFSFTPPRGADILKQ
ncbi:MAG: outer membrane lipoprotein carrier protein LolA [Betaproteobacteria bacterium]|nr:MAG: outer membrane lipoprotein carrier protein LolA [Betaproteobacteria bacterium]